MTDKQILASLLSIIYFLTKSSDTFATSFIPTFTHTITRTVFTNAMTMDDVEECSKLLGAVIEKQGGHGDSTMSKNALKKQMKKKAVEKKKIAKAALRQPAIEIPSLHSDYCKSLTRKRTIRSNQRKLPKLILQCRNDISGALNILGDAYPHMAFIVKEKNASEGVGKKSNVLTYDHLIDVLKGGEYIDLLFNNVDNRTIDDLVIIDGQSIVATLEILGKNNHVPAALNLLRLAVEGMFYNRQYCEEKKQTHVNDYDDHEKKNDQNELRQVYRAIISLLGHAHNCQIPNPHSYRLIMYLIHHHMPIVSQIQPGVEIYHAALNALGKLGECGLISELLNEMERSSKKMMQNNGDDESSSNIPNCAPPIDKMAYQTAISSLARNNHSKEAIQILNRMQHAGFVPDINLYNQLLIAIAKEAGNGSDPKLHKINNHKNNVLPWHKVALQLLHEIEQNQFRPTDQIYDSVISVCMSEGEWNMVAQISKKAELQRYCGMKRNINSVDYSAMSENDPISLPLQSKSMEFASTGIESAAIAYFDNLKAFRKFGKSSEPWWEIGRYTRSDNTSLSDERTLGLRSIIIGIQPHKNPFRNGLSLVFFDEANQIKLGRMLLRNASSRQLRTCTTDHSIEPLYYSSLVGMEVHKERRGEGLSKIFVALWLRLCLDTNTYPRAAVMNKPLICRVLMGFQFVPQNGGSRVELIRLNNERNKEKCEGDYIPQFALYSPSAKSLKGLFSQRALHLQNIIIMDHPPASVLRQSASIIYVKSEFEHPITILENAVKYKPPASLLNDELPFLKQMDPGNQRSEIQRKNLSNQIDDIMQTNIKDSSSIGKFELFSNIASRKGAFLSNDELLYATKACEENMASGLDEIVLSKRLKR